MRRNSLLKEHGDMKKGGICQGKWSGGSYLLLIHLCPGKPQYSCRMFLEGLLGLECELLDCN